MADYHDDLRLAHVLADHADSVTLERFKALDLKIDTKKIRKEIADRKNAKPPAAAPAKAAAPKRPPPVYVKSKKKPAKKK